MKSYVAMEFKGRKFRVPVDGDPGYRLKVEGDGFRCSGCNLPTPRSDFNEARFGALHPDALRAYRRTKVAVCGECAKVAAENECQTVVVG
jgi:hypothetical protein